MRGRRCAYYQYQKPDTDIIYCSFLDNTGKKICTRSTGTKDRIEAAKIINEWLILGIPDKGKAKKSIDAFDAVKKLNKLFLDGKIDCKEGLDMTTLFLTTYKNKISKEDAEQFIKTASVILNVNMSVDNNDSKTDSEPDSSPLFIDYLLEFWDYDNSPYIEFLKNDGTPPDELPGVTRFRSVRQMLKKYIGYFDDKTVTLASLTKDHINKFFANILSLKNLKISSFQANIAKTVTQAVRFAEKKKLIKKVISDDIKKYRTIKTENKVILTKNEAGKVFASKDNFKDLKHYCINKLALETACRIGELQALKIKDLKIQLEDGREDCWMTIDKTWNNREKLLTATKTKNSKTVKISADMLHDLKRLINENPLKNNSEAFLFYNNKNTNRPLGYVDICHNFKKTMKKLGVFKKGLTFHSYRHLAVVILFEENYSARDIMLITGHKDIKMVSHYGDHETMGRMRKKNLMLDSINKFLKKNNEKT